jgi:hypothetical protein
MGIQGRTLRVTPRGLVLGAEAGPAEVRLHLLRGGLRRPFSWLVSPSASPSFLLKIMTFDARE